MSRSFQILLDRYAVIRRAFDAELQQPRSSFTRLFRLQRLQLRIAERIRKVVEARAIRRASAPRLPSYQANGSRYATPRPERAFAL